MPAAAGGSAALAKPGHRAAGIDRSCANRCRWFSVADGGPDQALIHQKQRGRPLPANPLDVGGARRDRTVDLYNAIVALSQLSYGPETFRAARGIVPAPVTGNRLRR